MCPRRHHGFSLVELMAATAVAVLLLGATMPGFLRAVQRNAAVAEHNRLIAALQAARSLALMNGAVTVVCPSDDGIRCASDGVWQRGWITFQDDDHDRERDADERLLRHDMAVADGLRIESSSSRSRVQFRPNGTAPGSNLTLRFCNRDGEVLTGIVVSNSGRARNLSAQQASSLRCG